MTVQSAIADYIKASGIKQTYVAEKCGFTKQKMNVITAQKQKLSAEDYGKICEALNVPFEFFYNRAQATEEKEVS